MVLLSKTARQYCDFQSGSYWVYWDSLSGAIDSVYLIKRREVINGNGEVKHEKIFYDCYSSYKQQNDPNFSRKESLPRELTVTNYPEVPWDSVKTVFYALRYYSHQIYTERYHRVPDYGNGATDVNLLKEHAEIELNGHLFKHVKEFGNNQFRSFFAKGVGLIQLYQPHALNKGQHKHNWKLIRYHIE